VDYISEKLQPMLEKRLQAKGFVVLFWSDTGFVRFFSKQPVVTPDDLRKTKLFVSASRPSELSVYRFVGCNPVPLEVADILPGLQTGLIDCVCMPPTIALAIQLDRQLPHARHELCRWSAPRSSTRKHGIHRQPRRRCANRPRRANSSRRGRRENVESIEALRARPEDSADARLNAEWDKVAETARWRAAVPVIFLTRS
jgi:hypothetical protein